MNTDPESLASKARTSAYDKAELEQLPMPDCQRASLYAHYAVLLHCAPGEFQVYDEAVHKMAEKTELNANLKAQVLMKLDVFNSLRSANATDAWAVLGRGAYNEVAMEYGLPLIDEPIIAPGKNDCDEAVVHSNADVPIAPNNSGEMDSPPVKENERETLVRIVPNGTGDSPPGNKDGSADVGGPPLVHDELVGNHDQVPESAISPPDNSESSPGLDAVSKIGTVPSSTGNQEVVSEDASSAEGFKGEDSAPCQQSANGQKTFCRGADVAGPIELGEESVAAEADDESHGPAPVIGVRCHDDAEADADKTLSHTLGREGDRNIHDGDVDGREPGGGAGGDAGGKAEDGDKESPPTEKPRRGRKPIPEEKKKKDMTVAVHPDVHAYVKSIKARQKGEVVSRAVRAWRDKLEPPDWDALWALSARLQQDIEMREANGDGETDEGFRELCTLEELLLKIRRWLS